MTKYNNCVKVQFEIGHEASVRSEVTSQGFTHDWLVFVRGADNTDIHHFVEKVVFNLHSSFPKPRRVVKEPPYEVRESGYASFTFPIEVYLKSKDEPRKLDFLYDLSLNTNTNINHSQREKRIFNNPSEEFRRKLLKGGGVGVGSESLPLTDNNSQNADDKSSSRKSSGDSSKKHKSKESLKSEEVRTSNQFADLFGTPIHKTAKLSPTAAPKKASGESKHSSDGKVSSKSVSKHSPHKDKEKDKEANKKDNALLKEKDKDRERTKEKEKKADKSLKRPPSPVQPHIPAKVIKDEQKKTSHDEFKEKDRIKLSSSEISKNEKKEKKKDKKSRDEKDKKDRHKEYESKKEAAPAPPPSFPTPPPVIEKEKEKIFDKLDKVKPDFKDLKEFKEVKRSPKHIVKEEKLKEKVEKEKIETVEKQRHKHKKKEKNKKEDKELKEKEKSTKKVEKLPPAPPVVPKEPSPPPQPPPSKSRVRSPSPKVSKTNPLGALLSELPSDKGSDSESSGDEDTKSIEKLKMTPPPAPAPPVARTPERVKEKEKMKRKDKKSSSKDEEGQRKKKRKSKEKEEIVPDKTNKVKLDEDQKITKNELIDEDMDDRLSEPSVVGSPQREDQEISRSRSPTPPTKFTEEYVMELKDLQQKIMTLEDNAELQRVVQVIAETGQYEITKKTFDFDLCALDKSTVKRLQDLFFAAS